MASCNPSLTFIDSGIDLPSIQMGHDFRLLEEGVKSPILRVYQFVPGSVTYGHFIDPRKWLSDCEMAKRPTGGGLIFHENDFSFTFALPADHPLVKLPALERYQHINRALLRAVRTLLPQESCHLQDEVKPDGRVEELCMANPTQYDIIYNKKKVGGSAQRKTTRGFIHQCSLFVHPLNWDMIGTKLLSKDSYLPKLSAFTGSLFPEKNVQSEQFIFSLKEKLLNEFLPLTKTFH